MQHNESMLIIMQIGGAWRTGFAPRARSSSRNWVVYPEDVAALLGHTEPNQWAAATSFPTAGASAEKLPARSACCFRPGGANTPTHRAALVFTWRRRPGRRGVGSGFLSFALMCLFFCRVHFSLRSHTHTHVQPRVAHPCSHTRTNTSFTFSL